MANILTEAFAVATKFLYPTQNRLLVAMYTALLLLAATVVSINAKKGIFYDYGTPAGDSVLHQADTVHQSLSISTGFPFFNVRQTTVFVSKQLLQLKPIK